MAHQRLRIQEQVSWLSLQQSRPNTEQSILQLLNPSVGRTPYTAYPQHQHLPWAEALLGKLHEFGPHWVIIFFPRGQQTATRLKQSFMSRAGQTWPESNSPSLREYAHAKRQTQCKVSTYAFLAKCNQPIIANPRQSKFDMYIRMYVCMYVCMSVHAHIRLVSTTKRTSKILSWHSLGVLQVCARSGCMHPKFTHPGYRHKWLLSVSLCHACMYVTTEAF